MTDSSKVVPRPEAGSTAPPPAKKGTATKAPAAAKAPAAKKSPSKSKPKAAKPAKAKATGTGIVRAPSTVSKDGEAIDEFDGKSYPVTRFPTVKQKDGTYVRGTVTRANLPAWRAAKKAKREQEAAAAAKAKAAAKKATPAKKAPAAKKAAASKA